MSKINAGPWSGALTENSILVKASVKADITSGSLIVSKTPAFASPAEFPANFKVVGGYENKIFEANATGLTPGTPYHYRLKLNGALESTKAGKFRTAPPVGTPAGFRFGVSSCGNSGLFAGTSSTAAYEALRKTPDLLFFFHLGDLHYENLTTEEVPKRLKAYDEKIAQVGIGELFREMPVPYTWDDHDFLGDDSRGADSAISAHAPKARLAYDLYVPHYGLPAESGIYQSFQIGRVLFIATDSRSFQKPAQEMLGSIAALQSSGSKKGGPYSHGSFKGNKQYGICGITYNAAGKAHVLWKGFNAGSSTANPEKRVQYEFDAAATYSDF